MKEKKGYFPLWMKEPVPEEYKVKYLKMSEIISRLKAGETIFLGGHSSVPATGRTLPPQSCFEKDDYRKRIHHKTIEKLKREEVIIFHSEFGLLGTQMWILNRNSEILK